MAERVPFVLGKGWAHSRDTLYFYGATREANENDEFWSVVLRRVNGEWGFWTVDILERPRSCGEQSDGTNRKS